jgi:ribosomal protein L23
MATKMQMQKDFVQECVKRDMTRPEIAEALSEEFSIKITYAYNVVYRELAGDEYKVAKEQRRSRNSVPKEKRTWNNRYVKSNNTKIDEDDIDLSAL